MTISNNILFCDHRKYCVSCHENYWVSDETNLRKYYHCKYCHMDILCKFGLAISFEYDEFSINKTIRCNVCHEIVEERIWPEVKQKVKD